MKEMACMLVPSLEEMKFHCGYRNRRGNTRGVRGTCRHHFPSFLHILVLYHFFLQVSKVLRALNLCDKTYKS